MSKILVTGASGFIGSALVKKLEENGHSVYGFYRYMSDDRYDFYKPENIIFGDIRDREAVQRAVGESKPDTVIHLAAITPVSYSFSHPLEVSEANYLGTINIAHACLENNIEHLIHASTSEVYGTQEIVPTPEDAKLNPNSPYAVAKVAAEEYLKMLDDVYGLNYTIIRPFNTFGRANVRKRYYVVERAITQALEKNEIRLYSSKPKRVFLFRDDHVENYLCVVGNKKAYKQTINISTDRAYSIEEMAKVVAETVYKMTGKRPRIKFDERPDRPYEIPVLWGTNEKAKRLLGWEPKYDIHEGIKKATKEWKKVLGV